jgi:hypothetical protein
LTNLSARTSSCTAPSPCTRAATKSRRAQGQRFLVTVTTSFKAAPSGLVTSAMVLA